MIRAIAAATLASAVLAAPASAAPSHPYVGTCGGPTDTPEAAQYAWQGDSVAVRELIPSHDADAWLCATLLYPSDLAAYPGPRPAVVSIPPTGGNQDSNMWSARDLAGHGYVVLIVAALGQGGSEPVGVGPCLVSNPTSGSCPLPGPPGDFSPISINSSNLVDAEISGVDWLLSSSDPLPVDPSRIGAEGFSAGAIASSIAQQLDPRLKAIVALDNLTSRRSGDEGQASCPANDSVEPGDLIVPRAPALGEASDSCPVDLIGADRKKDGWSHWRAATVPSMEVVFKGTTHMSFGGGKTGTKTPEQTTHEFEYYVRAWFDRWLQGDTSAESSLLSSTVEGAPTASFLSATYHSAAYLPDLGVDCGDLGQCLTP